MGAFGFSWGNSFLGYRNDKPVSISGNGILSLSEPELAKYINALSTGQLEQRLMELVLGIPEVFAPIHTIASRVAGGVYSLKGNDGQVDKDNAYWNKFSKYPNWQETFSELVYLSVFHKYATGNRYFYKNCPTGRGKIQYINAIRVLDSQYISIVEQSTRPKLNVTTEKKEVIKSYKFDDGTKDSQEFLAEFVYHDSFISIPQDRTTGKFKGLSPLHACGYAITNLQAVYEARGTIFKKHGALGFLVSKKSDADGLVALNPNEKKEAQSDYDNTYGLTGGKSPVGITRFPLEFVRTGMSIKELEPFVETEADAAAIYTALQVPTDLMPRRDNSTFENMKSAERNLYQNVIINEAKEVCNILTEFLGFADMQRVIDVSFDHVEVLQEDKQHKAEVDFKNHETYQGRFLSGIITLNQWRALVKEEPSTNPLYDKLVFDMTPQELQTIKDVLSVKSQNINTSVNGAGNTAGAKN